MLYVEITFVKAYESEIPENCYCQVYDLHYLLCISLDQKLQLNIY